MIPEIFSRAFLTPLVDFKKKVLEPASRMWLRYTLANKAHWNQALFALT